MKNLYMYITAPGFSSSIIFLITSGALLGIDKIISLWSSKANNILNNIPQNWRRCAEISFIISTIFYAGFRAWSDEYNRRVTIESELYNIKETENDNLFIGRKYDNLMKSYYSSRMDIIKVTRLYDNDRDSIRSIRAYIENTGKLPASFPLIKAIAYNAPGILSKNTTDGIMNYLYNGFEESASQAEFTDQLGPGLHQFYDIGIVNSFWEISNNSPTINGNIYVFSILRYFDEETPNGQYKYTEYCQYIEPKTYNLKYCQGHNLYYTK